MGFSTILMKITMQKPKLFAKLLEHPKTLLILRGGIVAVTFILVLVAVRDVSRASSIPKRPITTFATDLSGASAVRNDAASLHDKFNALTIRQSKNHAHLYDPNSLGPSFSAIDSDLSLGAIKAAQLKLHDLQSKYSEWDNQLTKIEQKPAIIVQAPPPPVEFTTNVPILLYHKTPANFDAILTELEVKHYQTITIAQLLTSLRTKKALPGKPIIITFDDGFRDQLKAFALLQKHQMKAVFYIISGGDISKGCIGVNRTNYTCGDEYLSWDDVRTLDASGLIEIGGHTVDHLSLPAQSPAIQQFEITQNKTDIETAIGHKISAFAYPMGNFNTTSINLARAAGYTSAMSTLGGTLQSASITYSLHRIREASVLP